MPGYVCRISRAVVARKPASGFLVQGSMSQFGKLLIEIVTPLALDVALSAMTVNVSGNVEKTGTHA